MSLAPVPHLVTGVRRETGDTVSLTLAPAGEERLRPFVPGRFAMVYAFVVGETPVSVSRSGHGTLVHTIRSVGAVSTALCALRPGVRVGLRGPYGTGWKLEQATGQDLVVITGGIGLAPLRPLGLAASLTRLARSRRADVERGLRLKQAGNGIVEQLGGRAIHPENVRLGVFHRTPARGEPRHLREGLRRAADDAREAVGLVAGFDFPDASLDADFLALDAATTYAIEDGTPCVVSTDGTRRHFPLSDFPGHVREEPVPRSTALHSRLDGRRQLTGPLARFALSGRLLSGAAREAAREAGQGDPTLGVVCRNPYRSVVAEPSRWCTPSTRCCGSSPRTSRRPVLTWPYRPARARGTGPRRRRAACSTTVTGWTPKAPSSTRCWCRPRAAHFLDLTIHRT